MACERELEAALKATELASAAIGKLYEEFQRIPDAPADISTTADKQAQEIILCHLHQLFPHDAYCAEERTPSLAHCPHTGPRLWIVDPIDGSRGFARKNGEFSIMVAFVEEGQVIVGVVREPARRRLTYATRGGGCWRVDGDDAPPIPCRVSDTKTLSACVLTQSRSRDPGVPTSQVQVLRPRQVLETYSAGIKMALVARGEADVYVNRYAAFHDWDIAAGDVLVTEAGGQVTGLNGEPISYNTEGAWQRHGLLASNGHLHAKAVELLQHA
ncbi:MAG: 3'(2'),5'-bisphosphate nucleotidase CysQ [Gemmataceae bacterium]